MVERHGGSQPSAGEGQRIAVFAGGKVLRDHGAMRLGQGFICKDLIVVHACRDACLRHRNRLHVKGKCVALNLSA
ncbi:MAG: hypothetical protein WBP18_05540, partial [Paracoccaceae bacterium]